MADVRNAVATRRDQQNDRLVAVQKFIDRLAPQIARAIPKHMDADRMARIATTAVRKTPKLAECSDVSMAGALLTAGALGLEPNTPTGECYLVPYKGEVTLILGYQGAAKLFYQHPMARTIRAEAVYPEDDFDYSYGTGAFLRHKPSLTRGGKAPIAYYAHATLSSGAEAFVVLTPDEVKAIRSGKVGPSGDIADPQRWLERKVALKQLVKLLPKSTDLARIDEVDDAGGTDLFRAMAAERAAEADNTERAAIEGGVDYDTGEVLTPPDGDWPETAQPGSGVRA